MSLIGPSHKRSHLENTDILASNSDIISEILSWVPAEYLLIFETICKGWHKTITGHSFRRLHCQRARVAISGFFMQEWMDSSLHINYLSLNTTGAVVCPKVWDFLADKVSLDSLSNGLVCCHTTSNDSVIYVCNPATKAYVQIEWPKECRPFDSCAIASDPLDNPVEDYLNFKLIGVCKEQPSSFSFQIYSSKTKDWRKLDIYRTDCGYSSGMPDGPTVFASGVLYWISRGFGVLALDLDTEEPYLISYPVQLRDQINKGVHGDCIGESEGRLHYILMYGEVLEVWYLESKTKWALEHSISLSAIGKKYPNFLYKEPKRAAGFVPRGSFIRPCIKPLAFKDGIVLLKLHCGFGYRYLNKVADGCTILYLYNIGSTKSLKELRVLKKSRHWLGFFKALPYSMTLAPLESAEETL